MKEVEKTKSNVSAIVWTPSVTSRPIYRWLKPQTNMPNWKKRKPRWKQKLLACAKFTARNSAKKRRNWWRCRSSVQSPKKSRLIWASWKKCSRTGGCAPNDRAGPRNGPARDDRVLKDCVLSSFLVAVITASHHLLAPAGTCRSLFQRSNLYNVLNIIYSTPPTLLSDRSRLNSENQVHIKEWCININNEFPHINARNIINYLNFSISFANSTIKHHSTEYLPFPALCLYPVKHLTSIDTDH